MFLCIFPRLRTFSVSDVEAIVVNGAIKEGM